MAKKALPWWQIPAIITGSLSVLTALGMLAVNYATYASLPQRVEAGEQKNDDQDSALDKLTAIQQQWLDIYQQQQAPNQAAPRVLREWDGDECWQCDSDDRAWCYEGHWYRCP